MNTPDLTELMRLVVSDLSDAMGYTVHFHHGHMLEITNIVKQIGKDPDIDKRYPLIALQQDIKYTAVPHIGASAEFKMYIVTLSDPNYIAQERIDNIFEPYLRPIYEELMYQIANSGYFDQGNVEEVKDVSVKYERLFWGKAGIMGNDANIFGDWVDCIELDFSGLVAYADCETLVKKPFIVSATAIDINNIIVVWNEAMNEPDPANIGIDIDGETDFADTVTMSIDAKTMKVYQNFDNFESTQVITIQAGSNVFQSVAGVYAEPINITVTNML